MNEYLDKIMSTSVKDLAKLQYSELKKHSIDTLKTVIERLEKDELDLVETMLVYSASGDGYGQDNHYINLSYKEEPMDLNEILYMLKDLIEKGK